MGEEVETGHQQYGVDGQHPVVLEHLFDFMEEDASLGPGGVDGVVPLLLSSTDEDVAFGKKSAQESGKGRDAGSSPEESTPSGFGNEVEVDDGGDEVTYGVTLLHDAAGKATSLYGEVLEGGCGSEAPDTSHADAEETSDGEELLEGLDEAGAEGEDGDEEEIADQGPLAAISIRDETEDDSAHGPEQEGEGDGGGDVMGRAAELVLEVYDGERHAEKVDRVASPRQPPRNTES